MSDANSSLATPLLKQYMGIKAMHPDAILLYRLGDFYEMFFEDAEIAANILDITLTSRNKNDPNPVPLCGVPYHSVEPYIAKLLESGKKVAICEQVEDPKTAKGVVRREVTRVVTPGIVPDGLGLSAGSHNFLAGVQRQDGRYGLAVADISTGLFQAVEVADVEQLAEEFSRVEPKEVVCTKEASEDERLKQALIRCAPSLIFTVREAKFFSPSEEFLSLGGASELAEHTPSAASAASAVLAYLAETQKGRVSHITAVKAFSGGNILRIDEATKRNLELMRTLREGAREGSLLATIDRASTAMGARRLKDWLLFPLTEPKKINERLDAVEDIIGEPRLLKELPAELSDIHDIERIMSRVSMGHGNARDLVALKTSLVLAGRLKSRLVGRRGLLSRIADGTDPCADISEKIEMSIVDSPPLSIREGGLIRAGVSKELDELRDIIAHGKDFIARLEAKERKATGIGSLKVRFNKVFGYYIEVTNAHKDKAPAHYIRKQTLANAERFITPELKEYEDKIIGAEDRSKALEYEIFEDLRSAVAKEPARIFATAGALANADALASLATLAAEADYCRPVVDNSAVIDIREGRHPIVERRMSAKFVPNDVLLDEKDSRFLMITGPNMAGKSTVLRQTALIVLMAQMGSFVPASSAKIGVTDRIFTRVGASDALFAGQSTFMVEMSEVAAILRDATQRSLLIIDEVGRGTSTFDGLSIAWAVAEDIHDRIKARTMFATHYHELTDLALTRPGIHNMNIAVKEWNGEVIFLRRLVNGATAKSYGIWVAKLAGLPQNVIERAGDVLENLEAGELDEAGSPRLARRHGKPPAKEDPAQFQLFTQPIPSEVAKVLQDTDTSVITPIEALNILHGLKQKI